MSALVKYLRDGKTPIGAIACPSKGKVGISICNPKDRFNRELARNLAIGRAISGEASPLPRRRVLVNGRKVYLGDLITTEFVAMQARAEKYFNGPARRSKRK